MKNLSNGCTIKLTIVSIFTFAISGYAQIPSGKTEYFTEYGIMTLNFNGKNVVGSYPHENGKINALAKDTLLIGTWSQSDGGGDIEFHFNKSFSNNEVQFSFWGYDDQDYMHTSRR
jgi:hypothetical protein